MPHRPSSRRIHAASRAIRRDADQQRISIEALSLGDSEATVYYANHHYFAEADALDRLVRILMADTPSTIEKFRLIAVQDGVPQQEFDILRGPRRSATSRKKAISTFLPVYHDKADQTPRALGQSRFGGGR